MLGRNLHGRFGVLYCSSIELRGAAEAVSGTRSKVMMTAVFLALRDPAGKPFQLDMHCAQGSSDLHHVLPTGLEPRLLNSLKLAKGPSKSVHAKSAAFLSLSGRSTEIHSYLIRLHCQEAQHIKRIAQGFVLPHWGSWGCAALASVLLQELAITRRFASLPASQLAAAAADLPRGRGCRQKVEATTDIWQLGRTHCLHDAALLLVAIPQVLHWLGR